MHSTASIQLPVESISQSIRSDQRPHDGTTPVPAPQGAPELRCTCCLEPWTDETRTSTNQQPTNGATLEVGKWEIKLNWAPKKRGTLSLSVPARLRLLLLLLCRASLSEMRTLSTVMKETSWLLASWRGERGSRGRGERSPCQTVCATVHITKAEPHPFQPLWRSRMHHFLFKKGQSLP